ncbi:caldesmon isoform X4 [Psammomys obesus]|uniref:caldesmon isoform X4 n=1 Tax=Psammomys obesus TaxID=48139 RepID=UPI002453065B|nr:caldesmon isoform X4 [Psammomys obesus]
MLSGSGSQGRRCLATLSQIAYQRNDDDEEEAARERRRRARQERLRQKQEEESLGQVTEQVEIHAQNSVPDEESKPATTNTQVEGDEEAALLERLARREERRQKRLQEALERQKEFDPTITDASLSISSRRVQNDMAENETLEKEEKRESRPGWYEVEETEVVIRSYQKNNYEDAEDKKKEEKEEEEEEEKLKGGSRGENQVEEMVEEKTPEIQEEAVVMVLENGQVSAEESKGEGEREEDTEEIAHRKRMEEEERERAEAERLRLEAEEQERLKAEQDRKLAEEQARIEAEQRAAAEERERREAEERARIEEEQRRMVEEQQKAKAEEEEKARLEEQKQRKQLEKQRSEKQEAKDKGDKGAKKTDRKGVNERKEQEDRLQTAVPKEQIKDEKIKKDKEPKEEVKSFLDRKKGFTEVKAQNGEFMTHKLKQTENAFSRSGGRAGGDKEAEGATQVEAGKRLEELRRRRGETESEEFEKLKQKQQEAALELEELKKKREERRKVLEEEEQKRKQEEADRKAREEEEKRRLKEEIERRRAEAAEKRQKMPEDGLSEDKKPFKCFTPKGSSLKIEERAEFLNKSVQKSGVKSPHQAAVVSKIDSRLEQYTNAIEGTKASKPTKPAASDLPVPAEGVRNIKSMWEKGDVFSSPSASATPNKETAGLKVGVSSRINEWLTKSPDSNKLPAPKPSDLRPGDVSGKRNLWEKQSVDKVTSPTKQV